MFNKQKLAILVSTIVATFTITACGGGGSGDSTPNPEPPPSVNNAPVVSNVLITDANGGEALTADILNATYTYSDSENDNEGTSIFQWLSNGVAIQNATGLSYTIQSTDVGAQISVGITPVAASGTTNAKS